MSSLTERKTSYTRFAIQRAFIECLKTRSPEKITVTEIVRMAEISRGTFYIHYLDIPDLWKDVQGLVEHAITVWTQPYLTKEPVGPLNAQDTPLQQDLDSYIQEMVFNERISVLVEETLAVLSRLFQQFVTDNNLHGLSPEQITDLANFIIGGVEAAEKRAPGSAREPFISHLIYLLVNQAIPMGNEKSENG